MTKQKYIHHCKKCKKDITSFTLEGPEKCSHCHSITWDVENGYDPKHLLLEYKDTKGRYAPSGQAQNPRPYSPGYL